MQQVYQYNNLEGGEPLSGIIVVGDLLLGRYFVSISNVVDPDLIVPTHCDDRVTCQ